MNTYDIVGAGRFMANGRIVSNSGRNIQLQNLPQNHIKTLSEARTLLKLGEFELLEALYDNVPDVLSQLIRTMLIPRDGCEFIICDFSAIEARVLAWLAGEEWRLEAFRNGEDIYCASASKMFGKPVVKNGENGELRQKGKVAELACGYQGGTNALRAMGALEMGLTEDDLPGLISDWREANPKIVQFWWDVERTVMKAYRDYTAKPLEEAKSLMVGKVSIECVKGALRIKLPSERKLTYLNPKMVMNEHGYEALSFKNGNKHRTEMYAGKYVENITQATARDLLAEALLRLERAGLDVVAHVHDEVIVEVPKNSVGVKDVEAIMNRVPDWAFGLPISSSGYRGDFYYKD